MQCLCIDPRDAAQAWPLVKPMIEAAMRKGSNETWP